MLTRIQIWLLLIGIRVPFLPTQMKASFDLVRIEASNRAVQSDSITKEKCHVFPKSNQK